MARIDKILMLDHPGPLSRFTWPTDPGRIESFQRYNLIYGLNGSGKTSISRVLLGLETGVMPANCSVELEVGGSRIHSDHYTEDDVAIRVFNTDFVTSNVLAAGQDGMPPIFVLGAESANLQRDIDGLRQSLDNLRDTRNETSRRQHTVAKDLDSLCIEGAKQIKQDLSSAGKNSYNNYNKSHFRRTAERLSSSSDSDNRILTGEERRSLLSQSLSLPKPPIEPISVSTPSMAELVDGVDRILRVSVVSRVIRELEADTSVGSWVFAGLEIHNLRNSQLCLFCGQQLPRDRVDDLEAHFNTAFVDLSRAIDSETESLRQVIAGIDSIQLPAREAFYERLAGDAAGALTVLRQAQERLRNAVEDLLRSLEGKKQRMFESYGVEIDSDGDVTSASSALNELIAEHNETSRRFDESVKDARARLEEGFVMESLSRYRHLQQESEGTRRSLEQLEIDIGKVSSTIQEKERAILEHRRPAEELNRELHSYLGHSELQFDVKETGYEITRDGIRAESLSEGEKTAIALLYFLKSLTSRDFDLSDGVVVLDDPVSSLDTGSLFAAVGFIRERTKKAGQLFVFTHNFTFFREMRRWLEGRARKNEALLYMLEMSFEQGRRRTNLRMLDPLLKDYESDYHYLFSQIYRFVHGNGSGDLQNNYVLPNMTRRLLERFFAFCRPVRSGPSALHNQLEAAEVSAEIATRIIRFTDVHSHADSIDESGHDPTVLAEAPQVLRDVLDVMRQEAPGHFGEMEKLVGHSQSR